MLKHIIWKRKMISQCDLGTFLQSISQILWAIEAYKNYYWSSMKTVWLLNTFINKLSENLGRAECESSFRMNRLYKKLFVGAFVVIYLCSTYNRRSVLPSVLLSLRP